jgi:hypothetical protein
MGPAVPLLLKNATDRHMEGVCSVPEKKMRAIKDSNNKGKREIGTGGKRNEGREERREGQKKNKVGTVRWKRGEWNKCFAIEPRGRIISTHSSYSGGLWFKSGSRARLC